MSVLERFARYNNSTRNRAERPRMKPKPIQIGSYDDRGPSLFSRQRDIMNQVLSPTIRQFSFDSTGGLPFARRSPSPRAQSTESLTSNEPHYLDWEPEKLLSISDSVRESLRNENTVGPDTEKLSSFLEIALKDEERKHPVLDLRMIEHARLDKLLDELLQFAETDKISRANNGSSSRSSFINAVTADLPLPLRVDISHAKSLRRAWRRRYRENFFMLDQHRYAILVDGGRLKDVSFDTSLAYDLGKWQTSGGDPISDQESKQFEPGHWWLNVTCAERDGIVASSEEMPTTGRYGITALPLLTGQEELIQHNTIKYIHEGRKHMHIALISQVGRQIRILRGYRLQSVFAPQAGVRYDGLFTIRQYGCKLDDMTNTYRLELTLERVAHQKPCEEIRRIPRPSQLDDWNLYEKLEGDKIRLLQGEAAYLEWKLGRQEERVNREDWRRARLFRASFS